MGLTCTDHVHVLFIWILFPSNQLACLIEITKQFSAVKSYKWMVRGDKQNRFSFLPYECGQFQFLLLPTGKPLTAPKWNIPWFHLDNLATKSNSTPEMRWWKICCWCKKSHIGCYFNLFFLTSKHNLRTHIEKHNSIVKNHNRVNCHLLVKSGCYSYIYDSYLIMLLQCL